VKVKVAVSDIKIKDERFREDYGEIEELAVSIQRYGLLHPIVVDNELGLIAGERRLKAHKLLGITEIEVKQLKDMTELEKREIEIEENLKRKDFTWQEEVKAKNEIDKIKRELYGSAIKGHGGGWSIRDTADSVGDSLGTVSRDLRLAKAIEEYPEIGKEMSKDAAWKRYQKMKERLYTYELADRVKVEIDTKCIVCGNNEVEMRKLKSNSVDLVFTDPQYAINLDKDFKSIDAWAGKVYKQDDEVERVMNNISIVVRECFRVLKDDRHMYLWFGIQHYDYLLKMLQDTGFNVNPVPCMWHKTGGGGAGGSEYAYASNYEAFFFCMKGRRPLNKLGQSNVWVEPRVAPQRKVHPTEKPRTMIRKIIEQSSQAGELVIDPYGGSFSTLISALEMKRNGWSCDIDKEYCSQGILRLEALKKGEQETVEEEV
jgi:ParB/RepB/Spo0J family partition protein